MKKPEVTLALTHFNRFHLLMECVQVVMEDPRIGEIVISDDASTDGSYEKLQEQFPPSHPKVRLFRNATNQDCYKNKRTAVSCASNPWVILLDSDNILSTNYLDILCSLPLWAEDVVYCPEWAEPHFDYRAFSGMMVGQSNVASLMSRPHFTTALNTANYFFHKEAYLSAWDGSVNPHTADSIYMALRLLSIGKRLYFVPGLRYFHRVHSGSHYKANVHKTDKSLVASIESQLRQMKGRHLA